MSMKTEEEIHDHLKSLLYAVATQCTCRGVKCSNSCMNLRMTRKGQIDALSWAIGESEEMDRAVATAAGLRKACGDKPEKVC